jgi:hypothetical protein
VRPGSLALLALVAAGPLEGQGDGRATVTAVTLGTVYVGAGRNDGLREGSLLKVPRLGEKAAYRVVYLSSRSAAARGDSLAPLPAIGDTVTFTPVREAVADNGPGAVTPRTVARRAATPTLRGRVGFRYLGSWDRDGNSSLAQPGLELRLDGAVAPGSVLGLTVDVRSRRTSMFRPGFESTSSSAMGVYQAAVRLQAPRGPLRAVLGRQYAPTLAGVGLFDGVLLDFQRSRWGAGVMAGLAPDQATLAVSSEIRQAGFFVQGRSRMASPFRWTLTAGGMGSYVPSDVNREFAFVQATVNTQAVSAVLLQEVDYNRGWKLAAGEPRFSLTSSFLSVNLTPARGVSLTGGFDSRRNIRLYRDLTTPEELFDDRFRRGYWGDLNLTIGGKLRLGGGVRTSSVEGADSLGTTAWSGTMALDQVTRAGLGFRLRGTRYTTPGRGPGMLLSGGVRVAPAALGSIELNGGSRKESGHPDADRFWAGVDTEIYIRRSWFFLLTFTREWGRAGLTPTTDLLYGGLSWRF